MTLACTDNGYLQATFRSPWWTVLSSNVLEQKRTNSIRLQLAELKMCSKTRNLAKGKEIHDEAKQSGNDSCTYITNSLINMYSKCRHMAEARQVFENIEQPDVVPWNTLILGYAENGQGATALALFERMTTQGCTPNYVTFMAALKACISLIQSHGRAECLTWGKRIHSKVGHLPDIRVQSMLIDMYSKSGSMVDARKVFDLIEHPDVVTWTALMLGYAENGDGPTALSLFMRMKTQGCVPDSRSFVVALKACTSIALSLDESGKLECTEWAQQLHAEIGCYADAYVQSSLIDMYAKCGCMDKARQVFDSLAHPDVVSWNALITGYVVNGDRETALTMFARMKSLGYVPDSITFVGVLKACTCEEDGNGREDMGEQLHLDVGGHSNQYVQCTLINMYAKSGGMDKALKVFEGMKEPDVVSWTALISGYAENGDGGAALNMFEKMESRGCTPNSVTFIAALKACGILGALEYGRKIHAQIDSMKLEWNTVLISSIVDFYGKCGSLPEAQRVFDAHQKTRGLSAWNALLSAYSRLGDYETVFSLLDAMQDESVSPNEISFVCILNCCTHAGLVGKAAEIFQAMPTKYGIIPTEEHYNCMLDIICRSNKLGDAISLLQSMPCKATAVSWTIVLDGCRSWNNFEIGRLAFTSFVNLGGKQSASYVLMAHLYGSQGMWDEQRLVLQMRKELPS